MRTWMLHSSYIIKRKGYSKKFDHKRENALISYQILSSNSLRTSMEISLENLSLDIRGLSIRQNLLKQPETWKLAILNVENRFNKDFH